MYTSLTQTGFTQTISDMIARAAMTLPALTNKEDSQFLRSMLVLVMDAFWNNYVTLLSEEEQQSFLEAQENEDDEVLVQWFLQHANFKDNPAHLALAEKVFAEIDARLPSVMKQEYASMHSHHT